MELSRRRFLKLGLVLAANTAVGAGGYHYAHAVEPGQIDITSITLTLPRLGPAFDGYRLVQISDLHIDEWMTRDRLADVVQRVNDLHPDMVTITGDFITSNTQVDWERILITTLRDLAPHDLTVCVLGNHDHWRGAQSMRAAIDAAGIVNVSNQAHLLQRGHDRLYLAGVDDVLERVDRLERVLPLLDPRGAAVLLAHEPDFADTSAATGRFDLQLSGHSHGGQVVLPGIGPIQLPRLALKYPSGLYHVGSMLLYTNRGVGMSPPRVRFNCHPEITVFTLRAP